MIEYGLKVKCDACGRTDFFSTENDQSVEDQEVEKLGWKRATEVGDLCPKCSKIWQEFKKDFVQKMK